MLIVFESNCSVWRLSEGGREKFDTGPHDLGRPAVKAEDCPRCCIQTEEYLFILSVAISLLYIHLRKNVLGRMRWRVGLKGHSPAFPVHRHPEVPAASYLHVAKQ